MSAAMEPRIQYAKTSDGVNIAYWTLGGGTPFVLMPSSMLTTSLTHWATERGRRWFMRLAENRMLIRYDNRGCGHSSGDLVDYSLGTRLRDLEAVIERLNHDKFVLFGYWLSGLEAIHYAAEHPERVSRLILWCTSALGTDFFRGEDVDRALSEVAAKDPRLYAEMMSQSAWGWSGSEEARVTAADILGRVSAKTFEAITKATLRADLRDRLAQVRAPTLVLHRRDRGLPPQDAARTLAASIPDARLMMLEGDSVGPYAGDVESVHAAIDEFLGDAQAASTPKVERSSAEGRARSEPTAVSGTAVILFADIADSTGLTERLGDAAFRAKARELDGALRTVIRDHAGTPIEGKLLGDGVLAIFTSARQAIEAGLACGEAGRHAGLPLHLGLHAGDVIREDNNVYGGAVNIASRISGLSAPGEALVSDIVRGLARTSAGVRFEDRGEQALKGVGDPVRVWAVREAE
ncbi:MAG: adenylate/guanylate cyclase domain-containing protein [Chloroflexi bacterium]|nr:MAG: adenylate/guanylate cyclase domain-containing protein [Chloroflexota bacterium]